LWQAIDKHLLIAHSFLPVSERQSRHFTSDQSYPDRKNGDLLSLKIIKYGCGVLQTLHCGMCRFKIADCYDQLQPFSEH